MPKILLVEDDSNLREIYGARLEAEGYSIISASDGEEALAIAVRERPDLIISDIMMPRISGFDMIDILRQTPETKDIKVVVMTALSQDEDKERGKSLGADHYMVKSQVTLDDVVSTVNNILGSSSDDSRAPVDTNPQSDNSSGLPEGIVTDSNAEPVAPNTESPTNTSGDMAALSQEVENFVANDPLMNGARPSDAQNSDSNPPSLPTEPL